MAIFENQPANENWFDDSVPMLCTLQNHRIVDGHTEYIIKVQRGFTKPKTWTICKRYREFVTLHKELQASYYGIDLPPKKLVGNLDRQFIMQRQKQLQNYMNKVLNNLVLSSSCYLKRFLDPDNYSASFQETAFQYASMALRGKPDFHNIKTLPDIGWRFKKQYCGVRKLNDFGRDYVLTWISEYGVDKCLNDKELQSAFKVLLELSHPYIVPIVTGNCYSSGTLVIRMDCAKGSLRDLIYNKSRYDTFIQKCRYNSERLIISPQELITIAVQVLHALAFLHQKKIPYGNLHSGNIFIVDNVAKISDVENGVFGLASFYRPYIIENRRIHSLEDVDVYCFGHVLYEMALGERLQSYYCDIVPQECYDNIKPVLELILASSPKKKLPSVSELLSSGAFNLCSSSVRFDSHPRCKISSNTKELLKRCQTTIENRIHCEQNELRRYRKITQLQEQVESEEKYECSANVKDKRKVKKKISQSSLGASFSDQGENVSNSSASTTLSNDLNAPIPVCDKSNGNGISPIESEEKAEAEADRSNTLLTGSERSDDRSVFLQSIVNFNKQKLKKTESKDNS